MGDEARLTGRAAVGIPVGPAEDEIERVRDLADSLRCHVPGLPTVVLVDDGPADRDLREALDWSGPEIVVLRPPRPPRRAAANDAHVAGTLTTLAWLAGAGRADYLVKLDTDALVIADFRPSIESAIRREPDVGLWGAHRENEIGGGERDFGYWRRPISKAGAPLRVRLAGRLPAVEQALVGPKGRGRRFVRRLHTDALTGGYETGEHCLGGAYAVTAEAARRMRERGYLDDPLATYGTRLGEDVVLGMLVRACGLRLGSLVAPGEAFALRHRGLLAEPAQLVQRGHAVVHSVKGHREAELRGQFRRLRT